MKRKTLLTSILMVLLLITTPINIIQLNKIKKAQERSQEIIYKSPENYSKGYRYREIIELSGVNRLAKKNENVEDESLGSSLLIRQERLEEYKANREKKISKLIKSAHNLIGKRYVYGDIGNRGYDCSGLIYSLYLNHLGIELPRNSSAQSSVGIKVDKSQLVPGDLIFFRTRGSGISHVGIYIGEGNMIHASSSKAKVRIDNIDEKYYAQRYVTARRILYLQKESLSIFENVN